MTYVAMLQMVITTVWTYLMIMIIKDSIVIDRYHWAYVTSDGEKKNESIQ